MWVSLRASSLQFIPNSPFPLQNNNSSFHFLVYPLLNLEHSNFIHEGCMNVNIRNVILSIYGVVWSQKHLQAKCPRPAQFESAALN